MLPVILVAISAEPFFGVGKIRSTDLSGILEIEFAGKRGRLLVDAGVAVLVKDEKSKLEDLQVGSTVVVVGRGYKSLKKGSVEKVLPSLIIHLMPYAPRPRAEPRTVRVGVVKRKSPLQVECGGELCNVRLSRSTPVVARSRAVAADFKERKKVWVRGEKTEIKMGKSREKREGVKAQEVLLIAPGVSELSYAMLFRAASSAPRP